MHSPPFGTPVLVGVAVCVLVAVAVRVPVAVAVCVLVAVAVRVAVAVTVSVKVGVGDGTQPPFPSDTQQVSSTQAVPASQQARSVPRQPVCPVATQQTPADPHFAAGLQQSRSTVHAPLPTIALADVIGRTEATVLIGLSTVGGAFTEPIVREMVGKVDRPVIFPLSNPTAQSEGAPADLIRWTDGQALIATGSPYEPVQYNGRTIPIAQCNNVFIFPAVGLGVVASGARRVTDEMMLAAARVLGEHSPARTDPSASLLPALRDVRAIARAIATAVGLEAQRAGVAPKTSPEKLRDRIAATQWTPAYPSLARSKR